MNKEIEEMLKQAEEQSETYAFSTLSEEEHCVIDDSGRIINLVSQSKTLGVENDKQVERVLFQAPRYVGDNVGLDLSQCTVYINYMNAAGNKDQYIVEDLNVSEEDSSQVTFSWLLSKKVTQYKGDVNFIVCARKIKTGGEIEQEWNTTLAKANVLEGLEPEDVVIPEEDMDIITQLLENTKQVAEQNITQIQNETETQIQKVQEKADEILASLPEDYTELVDNVGSLSDEIVENSFFEIDYGNLYNYRTDSENGYAVSNTTGELIAQAGYRATDYIQIKKFKNVYTNLNSIGAFYDLSKEFVGGKEFGVTEFMPPDNAVYFRGSVAEAKRTASYVSYYDMSDNFKPYDGEKKIIITNYDVLKLIHKKYVGKKIAIIGDSWSDINNDTCTKRWHDWIAEKTGATIQCVAVSGTGYKRNSSEDKNDNFMNQALIINPESDLVIIFGSGNDCASSVNYDFGTEKDTDENTVGGCMNITIDNIQKTAPKARILLVSPAPWANYDPWWSDAGRMGLYTTLMGNVAKVRCIRFKDMLHSSDMHAQNEVFKNTFYNSDGVHPNNDGQKRIYPDLMAEIVCTLPET